MNCKKANADKHLQYIRELRDWYAEHKICVNCHEDEAYGNTQLCLTCLMDMRENNAE